MCGYNPNHNGYDIKNEVWTDQGEVQFDINFQGVDDMSVLHVDLMMPHAEKVFYKLRRIDEIPGHNMYFDNATAVLFNSTKGTYTQHTLLNSQEHYEFEVQNA
jgi:hypothetical protein